MPKKLRVGILFGGKSAEHEASLQSARNIIEAIDREKYEVFLLAIDKTTKVVSYSKTPALGRAAYAKANG